MSGGLYTNKRKKTFLAGFPPTKILFAGKELNKVEQIIFEDQIITVSAFLEFLQKQTNLREFTINFNEFRETFSISQYSLDNEEVPIIGFAIKDNQKLSPTTTIVNAQEPRLTGITFIERKVKYKPKSKTLKINELLLLLDDGKRISIESKFIDAIVKEMQSCKGNNRMRSVIRDKNRVKQEYSVKSISLPHSSKH